MKRPVLSILAASAIAGGILSAASSAAMADVKIYAAASCRVPIISNAIVNANGVVFNNSLTVGLSISCPLLRDHPSLKPTSVQVSVVDNSSLLVGSGNVSCRVVAANRFGTFVSSGAQASTNGTNSAGTILNLAIPATNFVDGAYMVNCTIPRRGAGDPNSSVASIKVTEAIASP